MTVPDLTPPRQTDLSLTTICPCGWPFFAQFNLGADMRAEVRCPSCGDTWRLQVLAEIIR